MLVHNGQGMKNDWLTGWLIFDMAISQLINPVTIKRGGQKKKHFDGTVLPTLRYSFFPFVPKI